MDEIEAEALRRWPILFSPARNAGQRQANAIHSAFRQGFIEGATWSQNKEN
ncbi:hypothetical protein SEA_MORRIGAN_30 [Microbacterium phage Morrigan]|nr:hypothetical protein SEA_MORRIGAN_30 [Microbacterium phage Morrigan]